MKTQTNKTKEIQSLIKQIMDETETMKIHKLSQQFKNYGPDIVDPILDELTRNISSMDRTTIYYLISKTTDFTESRHAKQLVELLLQDKIVFDNLDRSTRGDIMNTLKRIGDVSIVPLLEEYAEKAKQVVYSDQEGPEHEDSPAATSEELHKMDRQKIAGAIKACQQRPAQ